jgi:hypothetical protein
MQEKTLYERSLEALVEKLEAENAKLRAALADGRNSPSYMAPSKEREERRAEEALVVASDEPEPNRGIGTVLFAEHKSTPPPENKAVKRLSEEEKRTFMLANGWTFHADIYDQDIPACWENGGRWQGLDEAYQLALSEVARKSLLSTGWLEVPDEVSGEKLWHREGELPIQFHLALRQHNPELSRALHPTAHTNGAGQ